MRIFSLCVFVVLVLLSVVAWQMLPDADDSGKTPLVWVSDDNPARREQIELFNQLHPKYDLRLDPANGGTDKVIVQCIAGVGPELFDCYNKSDLVAFVKSGVAWDVTDELKKSGIDVEKDLWSIGRDAVVHDGRVYGFPTNVVVQALWFNKDAFRRAGIPYPKGEWTWEEFIPVAKRLTIRGENGRVKQYGLVLEWGYWMQFIWQWGGRIYSEDGTRCVIDSPEAIAGIQFLHDLVYKHKVMPSQKEEAAMASQGGWGAGSINQFGAGKAAMAYGGRWWMCNLRKFKGLRLGAVECPHGPHRVYYGGARLTVINKNSPRRKQALEFLKYMAHENYNKLVNHQADAVSPVRSYCYTDEYLHDPSYPQEDFNAVWRDMLDYARPSETSRFVHAAAAMRILNKQLDLVRGDYKPVEAALKTAARQVNEEILKTVKRDPTLRAEYEKLTCRKVR